MAEYDKNLAVAGTHTLETKGLRKRYGRRVVVKDVSLRVKSGEVVGLLGPNGAGKTTTFYMVVGLIVADGGSIYLDGKDITHLPIYRRAHMGLTYLPQEASVFRSLTVEDNIRAILELQKNEAGKPLSKTEINERLESLLDELSIQNIRTNVAMSLSGGERRRTEIARSLAASPKFILLDEPFAGVDPIAVSEIRNIIRILKERNIGTFQLFQETYHRPTYGRVHLAGPKKDLDWRASSFDRAMQAGIDDVGMGLLYGLYD